MTAPFLHLPPTDRLLSSRTGWTRAHWEVTADRMLDALVPYATPGFAQYRLPGRASWSGVVSDGLEGYARSFLMAAFRIAGAQGNVDPKLIERYAQGLTTGTDPGSAEAWPELTDCSQQMVEAASIAVGLHETRPWIWDKLDTRVQERVVDWLSGFVGGRTWDNNWRLFQVVSEQFLASVGAPYNRSDIESNLDRIEDWYVGDGWYTDGDGRNFDYYIGWAMHLYPLLWSRMVGPDDDGGRTEVYRQRLFRFLEDYPQFFGSDGAPVHQGRSLTYRFAALAPVWMGALADCTPLPPGLTRRLASGTLRHFVERGVPDERGLLTLGWYDTFLPSTQPYSGPASPYWASKGFLGLLLPADHPVWTERELPLPIEESDQYTALSAPGWLLHGTRHDGIVRLINHGSDHNPPAATDDAPQVGEEDPHYARLSYSTATAPESAPHAVARSVDGHLALLAPDGTPSRRRRIHPLRCEDRIASSWYAAELPGDERTYRIETTSVLHGPWEIRVHRVEAPEGAIVREGGHAVAHEEQPRVSSGPGWAMARTADGLTSAVVALYGWDTEEDPETEGAAAGEDGSDTVQTAQAEKAAGGPETTYGSGVARDVQSNACGPHSAIPYLRADRHPGGRSVHVSLIALSRDTVHPQALRTSVVVRAGADSVVLTFLDGTTVEV
ncbi:DUF2264 domain-containing protein [Streptomyces sp. NPDC005077]|uniref:DUF2264 domain-containing protein n=1 Tax=Streptomyces sp. NPDC005077 TaxID=3154292 RepID=UPI0033BF9082